MDKYEKVIEMARRRGFIWPAFELYGGSAGFYDYGPLGAPLKRCMEDLWRRAFNIGEGYHEIEAPTIGVEDIFIASGHVGGFSDPSTECLTCGEAFRADHLVKHVVEFPDTMSNEELDEIIHHHGITCPECGGPLGKVFRFNLMFNTSIGPGGKRIAYLRPETAQGMFIDFSRLLRYAREKIPFGATQIGKSYRNEISPRQGVIRLREFTQAEAEIFVDPRDKSHPRFDEVADLKLTFYSDPMQNSDEGPQEMAVAEAVEQGVIAHQFLGYCVARTYQYLLDVGLDPELVRFRQHQRDEMAHYAADCWDAEMLTDRFGWIELVGIADRTDYDLTQHTKHSQHDLSVFIPYPAPQKVTKLVVKPNMGVIGPKYKGKAQAVMNALKELSEEELRQEPIRVTVDSEVFEVDPSLVEYETIEEEVHGESIVPHVIEPSFGVDRILYGVLEHSYHEEPVEGDEEGEIRAVLRLKPKVAPIQVGVFPLLSRDELIKVARDIDKNLREAGVRVDYDDSGTIGRRYRRNDEIGTPYAVTVDYETLEDGTVTIRDRDSMKQVRAPVEGLTEILRCLLDETMKFEDAGKLL